MRRKQKSISELISGNYLRNGYLIGPGDTALFALKRRQGALLAWTFDDDPDADRESMLLVHLTNEEAETVMATDVRTTGLLEQVRPHLQSRMAWVLVDQGDGGRNATPFLIRKKWSEDKFTEELLSAAADPERYLRELLDHAPRRTFDEPIGAFRSAFWEPLRSPLNETRSLALH